MLGNMTRLCVQSGGEHGRLWAQGQGEGRHISTHLQKQVRNAVVVIVFGLTIRHDVGSFTAQGGRPAARPVANH